MRCQMRVALTIKNHLHANKSNIDFVYIGNNLNRHDMNGTRHGEIFWCSESQDRTVFGSATGAMPKAATSIGLFNSCNVLRANHSFR